MSRTRGSSGAWLIAVAVLLTCGAVRAQPKKAEGYLFNDSHVHLTNYIQEGTDIRDFLKVMGTKVGRATLFGIPLQQQWSFRVSGSFAPTYYLQSDAPLYYYSFTDAFIAKAFLSLSKEEQARFDPMITGFNPADMYGADHVRRVLRTFPGVFCGIGEFTIHKEFVSAKIAGEVASLTDPALDRIFDLAEESGLLVLIHSDIDIPFAKKEKPPVYFEQLVALFRRHPRATTVWAHLGVGRVVEPVQSHLALIEQIIADPNLRHVHFDLSWSELAKYIVATKATAQRTAQVINASPNRFLFGTDEVAPSSQGEYLRVYDDYQPLLSLLSPDARQKLLLGNHERLFGEACRKVRGWEQRSVTSAPPAPSKK